MTQTKTYTQAEVDAMVAEWKAKNANAPRKLTFKVSEKGCLSVYGLNARFPVSLYRDQWVRLLAEADNIRAFIKAHAAELPSREATS